MTASTVSTAWIVQQDIETIVDHFDIRLDHLADQLGIRISKDSYSPMID